MRSRRQLFIIPLVLAATGASAGTASQEPSPSVCGRIVSVSCFGPSSAVTLQLASPSGASWRIVIPAEHRPLFGPRIEDRYDQRLVCVSPSPAIGGGPAPVRDPGQIVIKDGQESMALPDDVARTCDPDVRLPILTRDVKPHFTADAMRAKVHGSVFLQGVVDRTGAVREVRVVQSLEPSLDESASRALAQWEFRPATRAGEPVAIAISVQMAFTLRR